MSGTVSLDLVRDVVTTHRRAGNKIEVAIADTAEMFGVNARWVLSVWRREPAALKPGRVAEMRTRFIAWLAADIEKTERENARRREMLKNMEGGYADPHGDPMDARQGDLFSAWHETVVESVGTWTGAPTLPSTPV